MENTRPNQLKMWIPAAIFLSAFSFSLAGLNPTFYLNDSPETVTACVTLGIPHPPGYPLHTMVGHLFTLPPLGHFPFRANLFAAVLASSVCALLFILLRDGLKISTALSLLFSLLWITGASSYPASLSAKTGLYQLTALLLLAVLWALLDNKLGFAVFLFGISLANHWMSMVAYSPGFLLLVYLRWKAVNPPERLPEAGRPVGFERSRRLILPTFLVLGLSLYLYLPLRAHLNPSLNWGDPSTWNHFVFNFLRKEYAGSEASGGPMVWLGQSWVCFQTAFLEFGGILLLALLGVVGMASKRRDWALGLGLAWVSLVLVISVYLNLPKEQLYLIKDYTLSSHLFILLFAAWAMESFLAGREPGKRRGAEMLVILALVLFFALPGIRRCWGGRQADYTYSYDYVLNGFKSVPRDSIYFCKGDSVVFPSWYFQWVEGKRQDLAIVGVDGFPMEWVRKNLAQAHKGLKVPFTNQAVGAESIPLLTQWIVDHNPERELYFSYNKIEDGTLPGTKMALYGLTGKGFGPGKEVTLDEDRANFCWNELRLRHLQDGDSRADTRTNENIVRDYGVFRNSLGVFYEDRADDARARMKPGAKGAELTAIQGDYQKSYDHFYWAEQWAPEDPQYAYNTGNALFHLDRPNDSVIWYAKAVKLNPQYTMAYFNWAVADMKLGDNQKAGDLLAKVLELSPEYPAAKTGLDYLIRNNLYKGQ